MRFWTFKRLKGIRLMRKTVRMKSEKGVRKQASQIPSLMESV